MHLSACCHAVTGSAVHNGFGMGASLMKTYRGNQLHECYLHPVHRNDSRGSWRSAESTAQAVVPSSVHAMAL